MTFITTVEGVSFNIRNYNSVKSIQLFIDNETAILKDKANSRDPPPAQIQHRFDPSHPKPPTPLHPVYMINFNAYISSEISPFFSLLKEIFIANSRARAS